MLDNEVKKNFKDMLEGMGFKKYFEGDENKIDKNILDALRNVFTIQEARKKLGSDIDKTIKQLREKVRIKYYD